MNKIMIVAALCGFGCSHSQAETRPGFTLTEYLNLTHLDYEPLSAEDLALTSDLIVRGQMESVSEGRVAVYTPEPTEPISMMVLKFRVGETLKGEPHDYVYVEYFKGPGDPADMVTSFPPEEAMLFLWPPGWGRGMYTFDHPNRGVPEGEPLWMLRSPQGFLLGDGGTVQQPLAPEINEQAFPEASLEDVGLEVRSILTVTSP